MRPRFFAPWGNTQFQAGGSAECTGLPEAPAVGHLSHQGGTTVLIYFRHSSVPVQWKGRYLDCEGR